MFKPTMTLPERFRSRHPVAADASCATSVRFGARPRRRLPAIGIFTGTVAAVLKHFVDALHAAQMRQATREISRYRDLIADGETTASFAARCCDRAARPIDRPPSYLRRHLARNGGVASQITERK